MDNARYVSGWWLATAVLLGVNVAGLVSDPGWFHLGAALSSLALVVCTPVLRPRSPVSIDA